MVCIYFDGLGRARSGSGCLGRELVDFISVFALLEKLTAHIVRVVLGVICEDGECVSVLVICGNHLLLVMIEEFSFWAMVCGWGSSLPFFCFDSFLCFSSHTEFEALLLPFLTLP